MGTDAHTMLLRSRDLRKNMTGEERHLYYDSLKKLPWKFRRQVVLGSFIVDFCCLELKLVIEVDGTQHYLDEGRAYDASRDAWLEERGYLVLRYSNADVNCRFDAVCEDILKACETRIGKR